MTNPLFRAGAALAMLPLALAGAARAQSNVQAPAPQPQQRATPIYTLPGAERFSLPPASGQPTLPAPAPTPAPTPTIVVPPVVAPQPEQARRPRAPRRAPAPTPAATPAPSAVATPVAPPPVAAPTPAAPAPVVTPAPAQPGTGFPWWGWALVALGLAGAGAAGFAWGRRRGRVAEAEAEAEAPAPLAVPVPEPVPAAPRLVERPAPAPAPVPPPPAPAGPALQVALRPIRGAISNGEVLLEVEIGVSNRGESAAEAIRLVLGMISASPHQDAHIAAFHASAPSASSLQPFSLPAGGTHRVTAQLRLPEAGIHVVTVGGRPMFVPMVLASLRWRSGLSVRTSGDAFMVGTGDGAGGKLGPFWIDRGARILDRISARRYVPDRAAA